MAKEHDDDQLRKKPASARKQRKDKSLPSPKNRKSPRERKDSKKDGHGKWNWGSWKDDDVGPATHLSTHVSAATHDVSSD